MEPDREANMSKHTTVRGVKRRKLWLLAFLVFLGIAVIAWLFWFQPPEPIYQGKTVSQWLNLVDPFAPAKQTYDPAAQAIVEIGEPAMPVLINYLKDCPDRERIITRFTMPVVEQLRKVWPGIKSPYAVKDKRFNQSCAVLATMGQKARSAVPAILQVVATNGETSYRLDSLRLFYSIRPDPDQVVPFLIRYIVERDETAEMACMLLAMYGPEARSAVPALCSAVQDEVFTRWRAALALLAIGESMDLALPVIKEHLEYENPEYCDFLVNDLGALGERAKPLVPGLLRLLESEHDHVRKSATNALKHIDPEAAAKGGIQ